MSSKSRLLKLLGYALDYAPIIITVLLATLASLTAIGSSADAQELLQWTLAVLALMATTQLIDRFRILRSIDDRIEKLAISSSESIGANDFFSPTIPDLQERLHQAKSIAISGVSLSRTSVGLWSVLQERLSHHIPVRIMVVDPDHSAIEMAAFRMQRHQDAIRIKTEIIAALGNFEALYEQKSTRNKAFQLRLLPTVPSYGIWIIDGGSEKAEIWVQIYSFRDTAEPAFHLLPHRDSEWFSHFERQFENMWNVSKPWQPQKSTER